MIIPRRRVLKTGLCASAGLIVAFRLPLTLKAAENSPASFEPNAYIRVDSDNTVTLWVTRSEMGQGVRTNLPAAIAEELEVELSAVRLEQAMPGQRFKGIRLRTSGSGSSSGSFLALRKAGATAREMLIAAAALTWGVDKNSCRAESGTILHMASGRRLSYGALATRAAQQIPPANPPLKDPRDFRLIGKPLHRADGPAIVRGAAIYGIDVKVPGMLVAVVERCPYFGGRVASFDPAKALATAGVRHVVPVTKGISTGVAVVADNTWAAMKGREALTVKWDPGPNRDFNSDEFIQKVESSCSLEGYPVRREGDIKTAVANSTKHVDATYRYPFQAHAPLEPMNCIADVRRDSCEVWAPTQTPETAYKNIMEMTGLSGEAVKVHTTLMGGGFGRRLFVDYVDEAVEISKAVGKPVQSIWTRADDMRHGFFHPASVEQLSAGFDRAGKLLYWRHTSAGSPLSMFGLPTAEEKADLQRMIKEESPWGQFDNPYNFPTMKADYVSVDSPVPSGAWRAVEYPSRVFARESFLDEIAVVQRVDPLQLRINLLAPGDTLKLGEQNIDRARMIRVLEVVREKSEWSKLISHSAGRLWGRGIALNIYHAGSYMAQVAEVSLAKDFSDLRVHRIVCVFDCGLAINPAGLEGQVESGITWGLSATLHGRIDIRNGRVEQQNYRDFAVIRMHEMPAIESHIVASNAKPGGFGEHPVPPVAPAVANAIFNATGKRIRRLPIGPELLQA